MGMIRMLILRGNIFLYPIVKCQDKYVFLYLVALYRKNITEIAIKTLIC
jgi:hypothetical protein